MTKHKLGGYLPHLLHSFYPDHRVFLYEEKLPELTTTKTTNSWRLRYFDIREKISLTEIMLE